MHVWGEMTCKPRTRRPDSCPGRGQRLVANIHCRWYSRYDSQVPHGNSLDVHKCVTLAT